MYTDVRYFCVCFFFRLRSPPASAVLLKTTTSTVFFPDFYRMGISQIQLSFAQGHNGIATVKLNVALRELRPPEDPTHAHTEERFRIELLVKTLGVASGCRGRTGRLLGGRGRSGRLLGGRGRLGGLLGGRRRSGRLLGVHGRSWRPLCPQAQNDVRGDRQTKMIRALHVGWPQVR